MAGFDDHPNVVVLEDVVLRLILQQCRNASDPDAALSDWIEYLKQRDELFTEAAFRNPEMPAESLLNAMTIAGQFSRFSEDLVTAFRAIGSAE